MRVECGGFFDLQVNGFAGVDFNLRGLTTGDLDRAAEAMRRTGVTRFLPTLITAPLEGFAACARVLARWGHRAMAGIHAEGPYISPGEARGAHPVAHVRPASIEDWKRRQEAADGRIVLVTLAPEVPGALPLIEHLVRTGVKVAIGHSEGTAEEVRAAVAAGATLSTHLGNGCAAALPRHPNLIWEQLAAEELLACFIADGHHLSSSTLKAMIRAKTPARAALVTDATAAAAAPPGRYSLGGLAIDRDAEARVTLPGGVTLAGSALTLDRAVGRVVRDVGLPLAEALAMASERPAACLGLSAVGHVTADWDPASATLTVTGVVDA